METAITEIRNLTFNDVDAIALLEELQQAYPGAKIYINRDPLSYFLQYVKIPMEPNQITTDALSGNRIKFKYCGLDKVINLRHGFIRKDYFRGVRSRILQNATHF